MPLHEMALLIAWLVLPPAGLMVAAPQKRRLALRMAIEYFAALSVCTLVLPFFTGVARWESCLFDEWEHPPAHVPFVLAGLLWTRPSVALAVGLALAALARRQLRWPLIAGAVLIPAVLEALTLLGWLGFWSAQVAAIAITWPNVPENVLSPQRVAIVGISYFGPPMLAGAMIGLRLMLLPGTRDAG
jgi:hypothetical protein